MLETFITMCCIFAVVAYFTTKKLGLLEPVPLDPKARVASYTSSVLNLLKEQLIQSRLETCEPGRVEFAKGDAEGAIWVADGIVHLQRAGQERELPLGDKGDLTFAMQGSELSISILASETASGAEHSTQITIPVASA